MPPFLAQQAGELLGRQGLDEEIPLQHVTTAAGEKGDLVVRLDTLGDGGQPQVVGDVDNAGDDGSTTRVGGHIADKKAVDLETVDGEPPQIVEARITGAEVVLFRLTPRSLSFAWSAPPRRDRS